MRCKAGRLAPSDPEAFSTTMRLGVAAGSIKFTAGSDLEDVYDDAFYPSSAYKTPNGAKRDGDAAITDPDARADVQLEDYDDAGRFCSLSRFEIKISRALDGDYTYYLLCGVFREVSRLFWPLGSSVFRD